MLYRCWSCGWQINQRRSVTDEKEIGVHLLYNHKPFCSDQCIDQYKKLKNKNNHPIAPMADQDENLWKVERKIRRKVGYIRRSPVY